MSAHVTWSELDATRQGMASDEESRRVRDHLAACPECTASMGTLLDEERELSESLAPAGFPKEHREETTALAVGKFRELNKAGVKPVRRAWEAILPAIAAAVLLVALMAGMFKTSAVRPIDEDPVARALKDLSVPADAESARARLVRFGHKALPALKAAESAATGELQENLAYLREVILNSKPRVLFIYSHPSNEYLALGRFLVKEPAFLAHRIQFKADPPLRGDVSEWAAKFPEQAPERFHRAITEMPRTIEELAEYDIIVAGDCLASEAGPAAALLDPFVRKLGGSVLFIAGPHSAGENSLARATPDLLPIEFATAGDTAPQRVLMTEAGRTHPALGVESRETFFNNVPDVRWVQASTSRPGSTVLLAMTSGTPLLAIRSAGRGQVGFVGSDELYMWRAKVGQEKYHHPLYRALLGALANR